MLKKLFNLASLCVLVILFTACSKQNYQSYLSQNMDFSSGGYGNGYYRNHNAKQFVAPNSTVINSSAVTPTATVAELSTVIEKNEDLTASAKKSAGVLLNTKSSKLAKTKAAITLQKEVKKIIAAKKVQATKEAQSGGQSQWGALALCFFIGGLGIHRFYLGYTTQGILQILTAGGCGIWTLIDFIRIITGDLKPKGGEYGSKI